jgi:parallel beta-helix repeat protein
MKKIVISLLFLVSILVSAPVIASANTLLVPSQFLTIQQAINAAQNGDTVLVAPGTYIENINFIGKAITVRSGSGPLLTIIDGNHSNIVVTFNSGETSLSVLSGFTVTNGSPGFNPFSDGGGILISGAAPTITGNIITNNTSSFEGGGISVQNNGSPRIINNTISNNTANGFGGGIGVGFASPIIQDNIITNNTNSSSGGGIGIRGESSAQILDNLISNNLASFGGGIELFASGAVLIQGNTIRENRGVSSGGGIDAVNFAPARIIQNVIVGNSSFKGGGIAWSNPVDVVINNTIAGNIGVGIFASFSRNTQFINNIVIATQGQPAFACDTLFGVEMPTVFKNNNLYSPGGMAYANGCPDQTGINGNLSADPLFINPSTGDYHLQPGSPSIDAGDNNAPQLPATDLDDNPRIFDGDHNGSAIVDMGVYEFGSQAFDLCIQDDSSKDVLKINTITGAYQLTRCRDGFIVEGTGTLSKRGCTIGLQDSRSDRRIMASIDTCQNKATASVQIFAQGSSVAFSDRNTTNNTCSCPANN